MNGATIRCVRCKGRKKVFKVNGGYTYVNMGGAFVECPMCLGTGTTKSLKDAIEEINKINAETKTESEEEKLKGKNKERDLKDAKKSKEKSTSI